MFTQLIKPNDESVRALASYLSTGHIRQKVYFEKLLRDMPWLKQLATLEGAARQIEGFGVVAEVFREFRGELILS